MMIKFGSAKVIASYENTDKLLEVFPKLEEQLESIKVIKLDPERYMYIRNRSISALETWGPNRNGDGFPREDIKKAHHTFINSRVSVDHKDDIIVGMVLDSYFVSPVVEMTDEGIIKKGDYIENILALDKKALESYKPDGVNSLLKLIEIGLVKDTSMGAIVGYSICSVPTCMNIAKEESEYCEHIKSQKNQVIKIAGLLDVQVYEICKELTFFEDSIIVPVDLGGKAGGEGADPTAKILEKIASTPLREYIVYRDKMIEKEGQMLEMKEKGLFMQKPKVYKQKFKDKDIEYSKDMLKKNLEEVLDKKVVVKKSQDVSKAYDYLIELLKGGTPFDEALRLAWEYFKSGVSDEKKEIVIQSQKEPQKVIVVDMDGVVADVSHRLHYIEKEKPDWESFLSEEEVKKDRIRTEVVEKIKEIKKHLGDLPVVILTGRPENLREITEEQLEEAGLDYIELIMKPEKLAYMKDVAFKKDIVTSYLPAQGYIPVAFFDDKESILDMVNKVSPEAKLYKVDDFETIVEEYKPEDRGKETGEAKPKEMKEKEANVWVRRSFVIRRKFTNG